MQCYIWFGHTLLKNMWKLSHHCYKRHQHANHIAGGPALARNQLQQPTNSNAGSAALAGINISPVPPTGMTRSINVHLRSTRGRHGRWNSATMRSAHPPHGWLLCRQPAVITHHSLYWRVAYARQQLANTWAIIGTAPSHSSTTTRKESTVNLRSPLPATAN